nr:conserved hypothetical protein [Albugo laibachii Nc14]|eukprot:CCA15591.1 conserved hypothetical protein [Albugo laibachii Nc14]
MHVVMLLKWSVQSPLVSKCGKLVQASTRYHRLVEESSERIFRLQSQLQRVRERRYDMSTAVDVLYGRTYHRLPKCVKGLKIGRFPHEKGIRHSLTIEGELESVKQRREDFLRICLIQTDIPKQYTLQLYQDQLTCTEGNFEILLSVLEVGSSFKWHVVHINTKFPSTDLNSDITKSQKIRSKQTQPPKGADATHLCHLVQIAMNQSTKPLMTAFHIIRDFVASVALDILASRVHVAVEERWRGRIQAQYHNRELIFCYWHHLCPSSADSNQSNFDAVSQTPEQSNHAAIPTCCAFLKVRPNLEGKNSLAIDLYPSLPVNLPDRQVLLDALDPTENLKDICGEKLMIAAMRAHIAAILYQLGEILAITAPTEPYKTRLVTGEHVHVNLTMDSLRIQRADIGGLCQFLNITFDMYNQRLLATFDTTNVYLLERLSHLEDTLNTHCRIQTNFDAYTSNHLFIKSEQNAHEAIRNAVGSVLFEIVKHDIANIGASLQGIELCGVVSLNWERYVQFRQQHCGASQELSISDEAIYFEIFTSKQSVYYLVIELDKYAEPGEQDDEGDTMLDEDLFVRYPSFSLLQTSASATKTQAAGVQYLQSLPAVRKIDLQSRWRHTPGSCTHRKRKRSPDSRDLFRIENTWISPDLCLRTSQATDKMDSTTEPNPTIRSLLLHSINVCIERIQLQHCMSFARRRKSRIRYSGEASWGTHKGTGGKVVSLSFPEKLDTSPLQIQSIQAHLQRDGGFAIYLRLASPPFQYVQSCSNARAGCYQRERRSYVNQRGDLMFRFPLSVLYSQEYVHENPLEVLLVELICGVKPLCEFGSKLEAILTPLGRYTNKTMELGHFHVESASPFEIALACPIDVPQVGSTNGKALVRYRVTIQHRHRMGFVLHYSHKSEHPLLPFIQSALNGHCDAAQLMEALERTCIPLSILASVVKAQLLSSKYARPCKRDKNTSLSPPSTQNGTKVSSACGKKGGKGIKLGYKFKLPREGAEYYSDDKAFVPGELTLIPRSQTQLRLMYGNRCAVDLFFLENQIVRMQSVSSSFPVPSCPCEKGVDIELQHFAKRLKSILSEMASL